MDCFYCTIKRPCFNIEVQIFLYRKVQREDRAPLQTDYQEYKVLTIWKLVNICLY